MKTFILIIFHFEELEIIKMPKEWKTYFTHILIRNGRMEPSILEFKFGTKQ